MFLLLCVLKILLFSIFLGCDSKHFFDLIEGAWGEQPDLETPPQKEDEPAPKRFKTGSPTLSTASSTISSISHPPPTKHFIPPWRSRSFGWHSCQSMTKL